AAAAGRLTAGEARCVRRGSSGMPALRLALLATALASFDAAAQPPAGAAAAPPDSIEDVVLHPVVGPHVVCLEHPLGQLRSLGDALGADCLVPDLAAGPMGRWPVFYRGDGRRNEDWYGWGVAVLAPFDGVVDSVHVNGVTNRPGVLGTARASVIVFRRADGVRALYAHVRDIRVQKGDSVRAGKPVARVGNNGPAWFPHTHVGAWKGERPLQVRFDLRAMGRLRRSD
ncbi:MAG TPA: M23 family metallopeptidase, partial [Gemmatimonadaceae bacterium]|nr:M23 family metallopeptidase [Gemmatimonadaceae bacterium]